MAATDVSQPAGNTGDPSQRSSANQAMVDRVKLMRDVYGGTLTLRDAGEVYLPKHPSEAQTVYDERLAQTFCLNKLREAVDAASAKPFKTLVSLRNNTDADLESWIRDCDLQGNHLHLFGHRFFNDAMLISQCHMLVDFPTTSNLPNLAAQKAVNPRPYLKLVRQDDTRAIYSEYVNGAVQVTHARIASSRVVRTSDFKESVINQIYVLEVEVGQQQGIVQLWEQPAEQAGGEWTFVGETPLTMPQVPLITMYAGDREADYVSRPVFLDLANKQIEHWQSTSNQRSILSVARFPMLAASGVELDPDDENGFVIGPRQVLYSPEAAGRWYFVEPKGSAIEQGAKDLASLEMQMDMMALNPSVETHRQYVPQNERDIQESRVHSVIHDMALSCRDALERAVIMMGQWVNRDFTQVGVNLNADFTNTSDKITQVTAALNAFEKGAISAETWVGMARDLDFLPDDLDVAAEVAAISARMAAIDGANTARVVPGGGNPSGSGSTSTANDNTPTPTATPKVDFPSGQTRPKAQI